MRDTMNLEKNIFGQNQLGDEYVQTLVFQNA
jgi:hypothetical protein